MKKPVYPYADSHVLARARLQDQDYKAIQIQTDLALAYDRKQEAEKAAAALLARHEPIAAADAPPTVTRGETIELRLDGGEIKMILPRKHSNSNTAFIDWVNVTCHESSFKWGAQSVSDEQIIAEVSQVCESVFGFGITNKRDRGANFYRTSYDLGDKYGLVCYGGQRDTVLIMLNGEGCAAALHNWEFRLHAFLESATSAKITRLDISHDDLEGKHHSPEFVLNGFHNGQFKCLQGGRTPNIEMRGNWINPNGKGRTLYVGSRTNGKFFRGYEKGKQLGDPDSKWFRLEVEFKAVDRIIPFDALKRPHEYLAAAYPYLSNLAEHQERILTTQKVVQKSLERTKAWLKHQAGAALNALREIYQDDQVLLDSLVREGKTPKGLKVPSWSSVTQFIDHINPLREFNAAYFSETFNTI